MMSFIRPLLRKACMNRPGRSGVRSRAGDPGGPHWWLWVSLHARAADPEAAALVGARSGGPAAGECPAPSNR
jgi:hypothetical protein